VTAAPAIRLAYRMAFRLLRLWWFIARPQHTGANVALWHNGRLLVVRHSYTRGYSLPGGGVGRREIPVEAACRELREELGMSVDPEELTHVLVSFTDAFHLRDTANIFEYRPAAAPDIRVDGLEVVAAEFRHPHELAGERGSPHLHRYLREIRGRGPAGG
jgi:8-oxo-dGTP diphosphatase